MTFSNWLDSIGLVVSKVLQWIGDCFNSLKDNYIIMFILGIAVFFFLFGIILRIIYLFDVYKNGRVPHGVDPDYYSSFVEHHGFFTHKAKKWQNKEVLSNKDIAILDKEYYSRTGHHLGDKK